MFRRSPKKLTSFFCWSQLLLTPLFSYDPPPNPILVTNTNDSGDGSLYAALQVAGDGSIIDCSPIAGQTVGVGRPLPAIGYNFSSFESSLTILGAGVTIDGGNTHQVLPLALGSATITNLTIQNGLSQGGAGGSGLTGGGGGTGGGGALYVHAGTTMTISSVTLNSNQAVGGAGGAGTATGGSGAGGGGFGGGKGGNAIATGASTGAGGGGGGNSGGAVGGRDGASGSPNTFGYAGAGGGGETPGASTARAGGSVASGESTPSTGGGSGGVGTSSNGAGAGGGGGAVMEIPVPPPGDGRGFNGNNAIPSGSGVGGAGGAGGGAAYTYGGGGGGGGGNGGGAGVGTSGGGGGLTGPGGDGGLFGGGGGAAGPTQTGGNGGFGAGGGAGGTGGIDSYGLGGTGGATDGSVPAGGGGGSGFGGAIFVQELSELIISDGTSFSGNSTTAGAGGAAASGGNNGAAGSSMGQDIFVQAGGIVTLQINGTLTLSNPIGGAGPSVGTTGLLKTGSGTAILTGTNTYLGSTSVNAGTLNLNGSVLGDVSIGSSGTFSGNATVGGNISNSGTISPGNSIGTTFTTDFVQLSTGVYNVEINSAGGSDEIIASGSAQIAGSVIVIPDDTNFTTPLTYTIISTGTGVTGTFSSLTSSVPSVMSLVYNPLTVQLTYLALDPATLSGNALNAAACFNTLSGSDAATVSNALFALTPSAIAAAFEQMGPAQFSGLAQVQLIDAILVRSTYTKHLQGLQFNKKDPCCKRLITLWADVIGQWQNQRNTGNLFGYTDTTVGATIGADYRILDLILGSAFTYTHDNFYWKDSAGKATLNSFYGGLYGRWNYEGFYLNTAMLGAQNNYNTKRHINFGTINRHPHSHHTGFEWLTNLGFGYQIGKCNFQCTPFVNLDYAQLHENSYTENGAGSLDLSVKAKNSKLLQSEVGILLTHTYCACKGSFVPTLTLAYINQSSFANKNYKAGFADSSCTFLGNGGSFERNLFAPSLTFGYRDLCGLVDASVYYDAEIGNKYWSQDVGFDLTFHF